jgi:hypothetical protein
MLAATLAPGLPLMELLLRTRSLGRRTAEQPETYAWTDPGGATVTVELAHGRVRRWTLARPDATADVPNDVPNDVPDHAPKAAPPDTGGQAPRA